MEYIIWSIVIVALAVLITVFIVTFYNKLQVARNNVNRTWEEIRVAIQNQFALVEANLNILATVIDITNTQTLITKYKLTASIDDIIDDYCKLESIVRHYKTNLTPVFMEKANAINEVKKIYNDYVLGYNNMVNMFPTNLIAKWFKFHPATYFRNNDIMQ